MPRLILSLLALGAAVPYATAGITFTSPKAGSTVTAGTAIEVKWEEGGDGPKIADLLNYEMFLFAGPGDPTDFQVKPITVVGQFSAGNAASNMIEQTLGEDKPANAYYIKMIAHAKAGGDLITYSDRFSYSGMTGTFPANIKTSLANIKGTAGPPTVDNTVDPAKPANANPAAGDFGVAYTMQTGLTRYAPMQPVPPTKITAKNTKPLYPTSSVQIATTRLPIPKIQTTLTQSQTFSVSARENTVAPAPQPSDDMQKFLNRWKD